jgi:hypothetical protein
MWQEWLLYFMLKEAFALELNSTVNKELYLLLIFYVSFLVGLRNDKQNNPSVII